MANWIASAENPLTARVFVNRVWLWLFGEGLVRTPDNFGTYGDSPSHPELLDHLATGFVAEEWSVKKLVREIVLTRAYQLESRATSWAARMILRIATSATRRVGGLQRSKFVTRCWR